MPTPPADAARRVGAVIEIGNCPLAFECDRRWDQLAAIAGERSVRYCQRCETAVHLCRTDQDYRQHRLKGHCVALAPPDEPMRVGGTRSSYVSDS